MSFLNRKIFNTGSDVFGLDLSDLSIKTVKIESDGCTERVVSYGNLSLPSGLIQDGEIKEKEKVAAAIIKTLETAQPRKIKARKVVCCLPETKAFLRIITIPQMQLEEVHEAIKWEMEATIPLPIEQVYYDWQILDKNFSKEKDKISLLVVAVSKNIIDEVIAVLELANIEPVGLEIESIAQTRSLLKESIGAENKATLLVDIGDRRTSFVITDSNIPFFTSSIPLSGTSLTDAISKGLNLSFDEAEKVKIEYGIGSDFKNDAIFKSVSPILENLASEIERSIDFYLAGTQAETEIDRIIMCGGGANTKGLLPFLSKRLSKKIELGDPWVNTENGKDLPIIPKDISPQFATAIGLALKGLHYEDLS